MTPERWQQVNDLFHAALERAPADRAPFLAAATTEDPGLRREVESLLATDESAEGFLDIPAWGVAPKLILEDNEASLAGRIHDPHATASDFLE